ncbi:helix-turn-helix transcriptional regulator [Amycolatopsis sp. RTGN1]|uniref:helix-turn-helix transcriptional regulator n=1 Tax=Amycolatopsis ponsaeliensis TaxID=2992142 RepID=UPI0033077FBC
MPAHRPARLPQRESSNALSAAESPVPEDLLTVDEVCARLRITRSTFNDWRAKRCAPPCVRLPNRQLRFRRSALERWLASHEEASA